MRTAKDIGLCPNIEASLENCYCNEMNSKNVENVVHYCINNYDSCEIYIESFADLSSNTSGSTHNQYEGIETPS